MDCDRYMQLLSARLDGVLTDEEMRQLEEHLLRCPDCRAAGEQLAVLQDAFPETEEVPAPEGFARGVMDRIRESETQKVIPLFRRPRFRALAGLAACLVLVIGLYGASQLQNQEKMMLVTRSFQHDVMWDETIDGAGDVSTQESLRGDGDGPQVNAALTDPEAADAPQIAAYAALEADTSAGGLYQSGNGTQGGGFARAVGADQSDDLPLGHLKGDALHGLDAAVVDSQIINFQHRLPPPNKPR